MLLSPDAIATAIECCTSADFYRPAHGHIFSAITDLHARGERADPVTVAAQLLRIGLLEEVGGKSIFLSLEVNTPTPRNARQYAKIVAECAVLRGLITVADEITELAYSVPEDVDIVVDRAEAMLAEVAKRRMPGPDSLFRRWTTQELLSAPLSLEWLVRGFAVNGTYGMVAGDEKALKSTITRVLAVAVASGRPLFDHFEVDEPRPVVIFVGEGGRIPYTRALDRVARSMGVMLKDLPIFVHFDIAPILSDTFQGTLRRDLDEIEPAIVVADPLYSFHGTDTSAGNLHEEAALLNALSGPCVDAGATLVVVNHFNKYGGSSLKSITQAGGREWCDSWWLVGHREEPDVEAGRFQLSLNIGSRQWGGSQWELDLDLGRFDVDLGHHEGDITWDLRRASSSGTKDGGSEIKQAIVSLLTQRPWRHTKTEIKTEVGGSRELFASAFGTLLGDGVITSKHIPHEEGGSTKTRNLWGLAPTRADANRPPSDKEAD